MITRSNAKNIYLKELYTYVDINSVDIIKDIINNINLTMQLKDYDYKLEKKLPPIHIVDGKITIKNGHIKSISRNAIYQNLKIHNLILDFNIKSYLNDIKNSYLQLTFDTSGKLNSATVQNILKFYKIRVPVKQKNRSILDLFMKIKIYIKKVENNFKYKIKLHNKNSVIELRDKVNKLTYKLSKASLISENGVINSKGILNIKDNIKIPYILDIYSKNNYNIVLNSKKLMLSGKKVFNKSGKLNIKIRGKKITIKSKKGFLYSLNKNSINMIIKPINIKTNVTNPVLNLYLTINTPLKKELNTKLTFNNIKNSIKKVNILFLDDTNLELKEKVSFEKDKNGEYLQIINDKVKEMPYNEVNIKNIFKLIFSTSKVIRLYSNSEMTIVKLLGVRNIANISPLLTHSKKIIPNYNFDINIKSNNDYTLSTNDNKVIHRYKDGVNYIDIKDYTIDIYKLISIEEIFNNLLYSYSDDLSKALFVTGVNSDIIYSKGPLKNIYINSNSYKLNNLNSKINIDILTGKKGKISIVKDIDDGYFKITGKNTDAKFINGLFNLKNTFVDSNIDFKFDGTAENYSGTIEIISSYINNFKLLNSLNQFFDAIPSFLLFNIDENSQKSRYRIENSTINIHKNKDIYYFDEITVLNKNSKITGSGVYNITKDNFDLKLNIEFVKNLTKILQTLKLSYVFFGSDNSANIKLNITGPLNKPIVKNDITKSIFSYPFNFIKRVITLPIQPFLKKEDRKIIDNN